MSEFDSGEFDRAASAYWMGLTKAGMQKSEPVRRRRKTAGGTMPDQTGQDGSESTDPLALIVEAIGDNSNAIEGATVEMRNARLAMAELERKTSLRADSTSSDMRSLTLAVQQLRASEDTIRRLREARWIWGFGGLMAGVVLTSAAVNDLPMWWRQLFG